MGRKKSRLRLPHLLAALLLFAPAFSSPAQEVDAPPSAVEIVEQYVNQHSGDLPLVSAPPHRQILPIALGFATAAGSAALALLPAVFEWDFARASSVNSYGGWGLLWGLVASLGAIGMTFGLEAPPPVDCRAIYGELLDIPDEKEKEQAAVRILKNLHDQRRKQRIRQGVSSFLLAAVPVSGYFLTRALLDPRQGYLLSDIGFAAAYALSLSAAWDLLTWPSYEERLYENYLSAREETQE